MASKREPAPVPGCFYVNLFPNTNTIVLWNETMKNMGTPGAQFDYVVRRTLLHEIGHVLIDEKDDEDPNSIAVMSYSPACIQFLNEEIKKIQQYSRARPD